MTSPPSLDEGNSIVSVSTKIMIIAVLVLFFLVAFVLFIHLYFKWFWSGTEDPTVVSWRRRTASQARRQGPRAASAARRRGLDPKALRSLPVMVYNPKDFKEGLECAVCLSEVSEGEKARLLPNCNHGFHVECIDMWFQSHSTCPLCRNPVISSQNPSNDQNNTNVDDQLQENATRTSSDSDDHDDDDDSSYASAHSVETPAFPTNVLFWGNETQVSALELASSSGLTSSSSAVSVNRGKESLVINIPRDISDCEDCGSSPCGPRFNEDEAKSPVMTRLRSLKRLLSRGKRVVPSPLPSSSGDIEQV